MKRIFISINLNQEEKNKIAEFQEKIKSDFPFNSVRWIKPDNFHITLAFLSVMREENIDILKKELAEVSFNQFDIYFNKPNYFPERRNPKIIWIESENEEILKLKSKIDDLLISSKAVSYRSEDNFLPHITIGRVNSFSYRKIPSSQIPLMEEGIDLLVKVNSFSLSESKTTKGEINYLTINQYDF